MNKKIAVGIVNTFDKDIYLKCRQSIKDVDYIFDVHNSVAAGLPASSTYNRYISYGALNNILLRQIMQTNADYIFLTKSNIIINDSTIFQDYINTAKAFGTWFMSRGYKNDKHIPVEDDKKNITLCLFKNLSHSFIFMLRSHITHCGYFNEGYTNINAPDDVNCLEIYDFYNKLENKISYMPKGYFPDVDLSLTKITDITAASSRPALKENTTDNVTKAYGKFYFNNKFVPGKHKETTQEEALKILEKIQQIYSKND